MNEEYKQLKNIVPFIVLMQNMNDKSPGYILEKFARTNTETHSINQYGGLWQALDTQNTRKLIEWMDEWKAHDIFSAEELKDIQHQAGMFLR
jgi:hypothetical protein